jgi:hypothetical protein
MALYRDIQLNKGTLLDRFGALPTNNTCPFSQKEKGLAIEGTTGKYIEYNIPLLPLTGAFSLVVWAKPVLKGTPAIASNANMGVPSISMEGTIGPLLYLSSANYRYFNWATDNKWHCFIFTVGGSAQNDILSSQCFVDGISMTASTTANSTAQDTRANMRFVGGGNNTRAFMSRIKVYDHVLSLDEINKEQIEFNNAQPINKPKRGFILNKPTDSRNQVNSVLAADSLANWNFLSGWTTTGVSTIIDSNSFSTVGVGGIYKQAQIGAVGDTYLIRIKGTTTSSGLTVLDGGGTTYFALPLGAFDVVRTISWVGDRQLFLRQTTAGTTDIEILTLQKCTGLWAHYNFQKTGNTLVDISGNGRNLVIGGNSLKTIVQGRRGILFFNDKKVYFEGSTITPSGNKTFLAYIFNYGQTVDTGAILGSYEFMIQNTTNKLTHYNGSSYVVSNSAVPVGVWSTVAATINATGNIINFYINGVLDSGNLVAATNYNTGFIGTYGGSNMFPSAELADLKIYNRVLTAQEIKAYHNQFVQPTLIETFADEGASGLSIVPREWERVSGSFAIKEIAISNTELIIGGPNFSTNVGWNLSGGATIAGGVYTGLAGGLNYCTSAVPLVAGKRYKLETNVLSSTNNGKIYIGGKQTGVIPLGRSVYYISMDSVSNQLVGFNDLIGTSNYLSITEVPALDTLPNGAKYMECLTNGMIEIPSQQAYGSWEFDIMLGTGGESGICFICGPAPVASFFNSDGYAIAIRTSGVLQFFINTTVDIDLATLARNVQYRLLITRTTSGVFTFYIKGGAYVPTINGWTYLNTRTNNTYTKSTRVLSDLDVGTRFGNLIARDGIKQ